MGKNKLGLKIPFVSRFLVNRAIAKARSQLNKLNTKVQDANAKLEMTCAEASATSAIIDAAIARAEEFDSAALIKDAEALREKFDESISPFCELERVKGSKPTASDKADDLEHRCKRAVLVSVGKILPGTKRLPTRAPKELEDLIDACATAGGKITIPGTLHPSGSDTPITA